jgi:ParB-like nuclease family protein
MASNTQVLADTEDHAGGSEKEPLAPNFQIDHYPVVSIAIGELTLDGSPRLSGEDPEHTRALADVHDTLPPITVHWPTMRVIDGRHRIRAAMLRGKDSINARMIDCDEHTAFILAVRENVAHGLPLSVADRKAAAASIIVAHPDWSDRAVAESTGLSDKTVSAVRVKPTADTSQSDSRRGRDGRLRPVNTAVLRRQAAAMMEDHPEAGLREIARATGLSPTTVRDVRGRIERGEDPVPDRYRDSGSPGFSVAPRPPRKPVARVAPVDRKMLLGKLMNDPSVRLSETGRQLLRWLNHYALDPEGCQRVALSVPQHWAGLVASLARNCAVAWVSLAEQLECRSDEDDQFPGAVDGARRGTSPVR